jgi:hypothetical protein
MVELDAAVKRFADALTRLETAASRPLSSKSSAAAGDGDAEGLRTALAAARSECEEGRRLRAEAAEALDEAIVVLNDTLKGVG